MSTNPDSSMTDSPPPTPSSKRRKLGLLDTIRIRNGGSNTSFLSVANTPPSAREPDGSDTEDEEDEETAQYYLNKMTDDTERKTETVFGKGIEVWKSFGGTVYADYTDGVKRKMREKELWNEEAMEKVEGGLKRKMAAEKVAASSTAPTPTHATTDQIPSENAKVIYHALPHTITDPNLSSPGNDKAALPALKDKILFPAAPSPFPVSPYPARNPKATQFHHSSAGIDPMGAHNRPIKPLPSRRLANHFLTTDSPTTKDTTTATKCKSGGTCDLETDLMTKAPQPPSPPSPPHPLPGAHPLAPSNQLDRRQIRVSDEPSTAKRRIVSGSFGSFEGSVGRFDERAYRLGQAGSKKKGGEKAEEEEGKENDREKERKLDVWKGRPWLRH